MKKVYFVMFSLVHKKSKKVLDRSSSELKEFDNLESARALFQELITIYRDYVGREDYKLHIKLFEPLQLRSTGKLTTIEAKKIDEFSFVGGFFTKDKNTEVSIAKIKG